jgi:hypothetical protein
MAYENIYPLPYCIPDELVVSYDEAISNKHVIISDLIPGELLTYRFKEGEEDAYNKMYRESLFAFTHKKGGWDCLRHYEILANGCIPIFKSINQCPINTMVSYPKKIISECNEKLLPYREEYTEAYRDVLKELLDYFNKNCTTSSVTKYFLSKIQNSESFKNILLITCHTGVNYTRELLWIGMKRYIQSICGIAVEYPKLNFLYKNYSGSEKLHGNGFTYSKRLEDDYNFTSEEIVEKIREHFWDLIIYGKVGPDELFEGSHPNMPLWQEVNSKYNKNEIVFLYGGDECNNFHYDNRYKNHILHNSQFGSCFVRELDM